MAGQVLTFNDLPNSIVSKIKKAKSSPMVSSFYCLLQNFYMDILFLNTFSVARNCE